MQVTFKTKVRRLRLAKNMKQVEMSSALGVTPATLIRIERGADLKLSHAMKIAAVLEQPVESLWETT